jgi:hypothetical protein
MPNLRRPRRSLAVHASATYAAPLEAKRSQVAIAKYDRSPKLKKYHKI